MGPSLSLASQTRVAVTQDDRGGWHCGAAYARKRFEPERAA